MTLIEQIKAALPIAPFVAKHTNGLKPTKQGWFVGRCPFHQPETDPPRKRKLWVNSEKGICGCFDPACPAHWPPMDVINFYARLRDISNDQAIVSIHAPRVEGDLRRLEGAKDGPVSIHAPRVEGDSYHDLH